VLLFPMSLTDSKGESTTESGFYQVPKKYTEQKYYLEFCISRVKCIAFGNIEEVFPSYRAQYAEFQSSTKGINI